VGAAPDEVLVEHIRRVLEASPFHGEGYRKAWAKLRVEGIRTSKERVRRLMREHGLQAPHRAGHRHGPKAHDGTITTEAPDVMWGTDMTATVTVGEGSAFVFVAVDHCTTECIGLHAAKSGSRFEALEPIRQGVRERFGGIAKDVARGLRLRHDHGSNYLADDFQQEVDFFGIESSPSFVREPEGNGVAERFIRTLKENFLWVRSFETIEELRLALLEFKQTYNEQWMLEKFDYRSPAQARCDLVAVDAAA
jgi:transposase InsO family protein